MCIRDSYWGVDWVSSIIPDVQSKEIPIANQNFWDREVFIGLTGKDWPDASSKLFAWRLRLLDGQGNIIASRQSFLWSQNPHLRTP